MECLHRDDVSVWIRVGMRQLSRSLVLFRPGLRIQLRLTNSTDALHRGSHLCLSDSGTILLSVYRPSFGATGSLEPWVRQLPPPSRP